MNGLRRFVPLACAAALLLPGTVPGDFPGQNYGGDIAGSFPVVLDDATARSYVVGGPDGKFLSLPGETGTPAGSPFPGTYIEVGFGGNFGASGRLNLFEAGNNGESAQLFLWTDNGGEGASMHLFNGTLIVNAPDYIHRQINGYSYWPSGTRPIITITAATSRTAASRVRARKARYAAEAMKKARIENIVA